MAAAVDDTLIRDVALLCSGFRPLPTDLDGAVRPSARTPRSRTSATRRHRRMPACRLDATGLSCATLTPTISATVRGLDLGAVLEIVTDDPEAEEGLRSWTRLTGNELVAAEAGPGSAHVPHSSNAARRGHHHQERDRLMATIIVNATHGPEDPERATLAFITGNVAATADQDAIVLLTIEGAWLAVRGEPTMSASRHARPPRRDVAVRRRRRTNLGLRRVHQAPRHHPRGSRRGSHDRDGRPGRRAPCDGRRFAYLLSLMRTVGLIGREHETRELRAAASAAVGGVAALSSSPETLGSASRPSSSRQSAGASRPSCAGPPAPPGPLRSTRSSRRSGPIRDGRRSPEMARGLRGEGSDPGRHPLAVRRSGPLGSPARDRCGGGWAGRPRRPGRDPRRAVPADRRARPDRATGDHPR